MTKGANKSSTVDIQDSLAAYDDVAYASHAFPQTNPLLLQGIAKLFGLTAASPAKARILEIGCASGGNIMAIASNYPDSTCVGLDYSQKQIAQGHKEMAQMDLSNLELKHMSVMDVTPALGKFDYIICHGVLSWVPVEVQGKIMEVCNTNLSENGVAYISYNTLPGWNTVRSIRDMMLYHTKMYVEPEAKAYQAKLLLKFVGDSMASNNNPLAAIVQNEYEMLSKNPDSYLLHDHLEENNFPFYFNELMEKAAHANLQYLADVNLETMLSANFPPAIADVLATSNDIVRTEQYMDYITNRRFRSTLLCHKDRILNRNVNVDIIRDGWIISGFVAPEGFDKHDIKSKQLIAVRTTANMTLTSDDPLTLALMKVMLEQGKKTMHVKDIVSKTIEKLKAEKVEITGNVKDWEDKTYLLVLRYIFAGACNFYLEDRPLVTTVSNKPRMSKVARYQAKHQDWITAPRMERVNINLIDKFLIPYLDGTNDAKALAELMLPHFKAKELVMNDNGVVIVDTNTIRERLGSGLGGILNTYAELGILEK